MTGGRCCFACGASIPGIRRFCTSCGASNRPEDVNGKTAAQIVDELLAGVEPLTNAPTLCGTCGAYWRCDCVPADPYEPHIIALRKRYADMTYDEARRVVKLNMMNDTYSLKPLARQYIGGARKRPYPVQEYPATGDADREPT